MPMLVIAEQRDGKVTHAGLCAISAGRKLATLGSSGFDLLVFGGGARELTGFGAENVIEAGPGDAYTAESRASTVAWLARERGYKVLLAAGTPEGKDWMPRLAGLLRAGMVSEASGFEEGAFLRHMYAGNVIARVAVDTDIAVVTIREASFEPAGPTGGESPVLEAAIEPSPEGVTVIERRMHESSRPSLQEARVVIGAGRGIKGEAGLRVVEELADLLGGSIGASRATVDEGLLPNDLQIGQTGKVIAPELYIACGISGAIQHTAGIKDSGLIVAINKDPEAPIFETADLGLAADFTVAGPELVAKLKEAL